MYYNYIFFLTSFSICIDFKTNAVIYFNLMAFSSINKKIILLEEVTNDFCNSRSNVIIYYIMHTSMPTLLKI
jgi:hypothetical protein